MPQIYDYTRVRIGDRVRDDQTLQDEQIVDIQFVGQWGVLVTLLVLSTGIKKDSYFLRNTAPVAANVADLVSNPERTRVAPGEVVNVRTDSTNEKFTVMRTATPIESSAAATIAGKPPTPSYAETPFTRLRKYIEDTYKDSRTIDNVSKADVLSALDELERSIKAGGSRSEEFAARVHDITRNLQVSGSPVKAIYTEIATRSAGSVKNQDAAWQLARLMDKGERFRSVLSGTTNAKLASTLSQRVAAGVKLTPIEEVANKYSSLTMPDRIGRVVDAVSRMGERGEARINHFAYRALSTQSPEDFNENVIGGLTRYIDPLRTQRRSLNNLVYATSSVNRVWSDVRIGGIDKTISSVSQALDTARFYGLVDDGTAQSILSDLRSAFKAGKGGAPAFRRARSEMLRISERVSQSSILSSTNTRLETLQNIRSLLTSITSVADSVYGLDPAVGVMDMARDAFDRAEAIAVRRGHAFANSAASKDYASFAASLFKAGYDRDSVKKQILLYRAAQDAAKSLSYGNVVEAVTAEGMRVRVTGVNLHDGIRITGETANTRVIDNASSLYLVTNINANGADPTTRLVSEMTKRLKKGQRRGTADTQGLSDLYRQAQRSALLNRPFNAGGGTFHSTEDFLNARYNGNGTARFRRDIVKAVKGDIEDVWTTDANGVAQRAESITDVSKEAYGIAYDAYNESIRRNQGKSVDAVHDKAMSEAVTAVKRSKLRKGPRTVSIDDELFRGVVEQKLEDTRLFANPEAAMLQKNAKIAQLQYETMVHVYGVDPELAQAILEPDDIAKGATESRVRGVVRKAIGQMDPDTKVTEAMLNGSGRFYLPQNKRKKAEKLVRLLNGNVDEQRLAALELVQWDHGTRRQVQKLINSPAAAFKSLVATKQKQLNNMFYSEVSDAISDRVVTDESGQILIRLDNVLARVLTGQSQANGTTAGLLLTLNEFGMTRQDEFTYRGRVFQGTVLRYKSDLQDSGVDFTATDNLLVDKGAQAYALSKQEYKELKPDILLYSNRPSLIDSSTLAAKNLNPFVKSDSTKLYALPGHGDKGWNMRLISTGEDEGGFLRQINAMRDMLEGKLNNLYVLDIENNPERITEYGWIKAEARRSSTGVSFSEVGRHAAKPLDEAGDRAMIEQVTDLIRKHPDGSPLAIVTHNKRFDLPKLAETAETLGMSDEAGLLRSVYAGTHPDVVNVDSMLAAQMIDPSARSVSVQNIVEKMRLKEAGWQEAHSSLPDAEIELEILNKSLARGKANINALSQIPQPVNLAGKYIWGVSGPSSQRGRAFRVEGYLETQKMQDDGIAGLMLREMQLDDSGRLVEGKLVPHAKAAHLLGQELSGNFAVVQSEEELRSLSSEYVDDLAQRRIRDILTKPQRALDELDRINVLKDAGMLERPEITDALRQQLQAAAEGSISADQLPIELQKYGSADRLSKWLYEYGSDWRIRKQLLGKVNDYMEGEFKYHRGMYEFITGPMENGEMFDPRSQGVLRERWHSAFDRIVGDFGKVEGHKIRPWQRQISVKLDGAGTIALNIATEDALQESINNAADRLTKHLDIDRIERAVGGIVSPERMREFAATGQKMNTLPYEAQDALRESVWREEIFDAVKSSRSDFAEKVTIPGNKDLLATAFSTPDKLKAGLLEIGTNPEGISQEMATALNMRDYTDYSPRQLSAEQEQKVARLEQHFKKKWQKYVGSPFEVAAAESDRFPQESFIRKAVQGKTVKEVYDYYVRNAVKHVGEYYDTEKEAAKRGAAQAQDYLASVFSDEEIYNRLGAPVQKDLLERFHLASYNDPAAQNFRETWDNRKSDTSIFDRAEISAQLEDAESVKDLAGIVNPNTLEGNLSEMSPAALNNVAQNRHISPEARANVRRFASSVAEQTSGGLTSLGATREFTPLAIGTRHAASRGAMEAAAEYLYNSSMAPKVRLAVAAIGGGTALFLGHRPNVEPQEESMTPRQRFHKSITKTEEPLYFRIVAHISGQAPEDAALTEEDLVQGASQAVVGCLASPAKHTTHSSTDTRQAFDRRKRDDIASRLLRPGMPIGA